MWKDSQRSVSIADLGRSLCPRRLVMPLDGQLRRSASSFLPVLTGAFLWSLVCFHMRTVSRCLQISLHFHNPSLRTKDATHSGGAFPLFWSGLCIVRKRCGYRNKLGPWSSEEEPKYLTDIWKKSNCDWKGEAAKGLQRPKWRYKTTAFILSNIFCQLFPGRMRGGYFLRFLSGLCSDLKWNRI